MWCVHRFKCLSSNAKQLPRVSEQAFDMHAVCLGACADRTSLEGNVSCQIVLNVSPTTCERAFWRLVLQLGGDTSRRCFCPRNTFTFLYNCAVIIIGRLNTQRRTRRRISKYDTSFRTVVSTYIGALPLRIFRKEISLWVAGNCG